MIRQNLERRWSAGFHKAPWLVTAAMLVSATCALAQDSMILAPDSIPYTYEQRLAFAKEFNRLVWWFFRATDQIREGYHYSKLTWNADDRGEITNLFPSVGAGLHQGKSAFVALRSQLAHLEPLVINDETSRAASALELAVRQALDGAEGILKYYRTGWKTQSEAQAGHVEMISAWTQLWEAVRHLVDELKGAHGNRPMHDLTILYVEMWHGGPRGCCDPRHKEFVRSLPPVLSPDYRAAPIGSAFVGIWFRLGEAVLAVASPVPEELQAELEEGDVIEAVNGTLTPSIVEFANLLKSSRSAEAVFVLRVRHGADRSRVEVTSRPAETTYFYVR